MRKASLAVAAIALVALAGCGGRDQDQLNEAEINISETDDLNQLSDNAASLAAEAEQLENQAAELDNQAQAADEATGAETPADENIQGM